MHVIKAQRIGVIIEFGFNCRPNQDDRSVVANGRVEVNAFAALGRAEDLASFGSSGASVVSVYMALILFTSLMISA